MDAPGETHLESSNVRNKLQQLSQSQTTLDGPLPELRKRKSLRIRPTELFDQQHASEPPSPLKEREIRPEIRRARSSKMSLFNLFSKPKVEKLRGYAESGLDAPLGPARTRSNNDATTPKMDLVVRVQNADAGTGRARPSSSKSYAARSGRHTPTEALPPLPNGGRTRAFDPPPLFQVWPQATKHGVLEVSTMSPEMVLSRPARGRISSSFFTPPAEIPSLNVPGHRGSIESRIAVRPSVSHIPNGLPTNQSIPRKLVVLVTSGFLLQYAETGPNDRMPEKALQLGKDSAAYASDLIPGRHHVLQIAQQVDQYGSMSSSHHSLLSRFSLRNYAARRTTNNLLLVMPDAKEMGEWMAVIRREIEMQGGKRVRSDSGASRSSKPVDGAATKLDLKKTPSQSHRYQVKRSPDGPAAITTPSSERSEPLPSPLLAQVDSQEQVHTDSQPAKEVKGDASASTETASPPSRPRAASDTASDSSSASLSADQQNLDKVRNSARQSHTSTVATSVTAASRTNSLSSTPPPENAKNASEVPAKSPFRSLSSYSLANRRSAAPLSLKGTPAMPATRVDGTNTAVQQKADVIESALDSPVIGHGSPMAEPRRSPKKDRIPVTQSVPNLKDRSVEDAKRDSKFRSPSPAKLRERPESFVADLPNPTTWVTKAQASTHAVPMHDPTASRAMQKANAESTPTYSPQSRPLRSGSNSFSLPLRVNPIATQRPADQTRHKLLSPIPAVHCLAAKVEITALPKIERKPVPQSQDIASPVEGPMKPFRTASARFSLFPTAVVTPPSAMPAMPAQAEVIRRSPSAQALGTYAPAQTNSAKLSRPNSLQVRTTYAPFLSSKRVAGPVRSSPTVPIRSLKPSRSVATMESSPASVPEEPFNFGTGKLQDEAADKATPLVPTPIEGSLPFSAGSRPPSRTRRVARKGSRTSLPEMDFGIPLAGLGPPAPPPQAPLPEIPSGSRPGSRQTNSRLSMVRSGTPIGVAIGDSHDERMVRSPSPAVVGLGIQVGGAN